MHFEQIDGSRIRAMIAKQGIPSTDLIVCATIAGHHVIHCVEETEHGKLRHVSVSHPSRYPTWEEIKEVKYHFFKDDEDAIMVLPRKSDNMLYVNIHPNCFHLWQLPRIPGSSGKWELV